METTQILDTPAAPKPALEYASQGARFANYIIDTIGYYVLFFVVMLVSEIVSPDSIDMVGPGSTLLVYLFYFVVYFIYYIVFESNFGKTPGKFITRTRVVTEDGERPTVKSIMRRTLCRIIPFEPFSFLGSGAGWHDSMSNTMVVKDARQ